MTFKRLLKSPGAWFISVGGTHHLIDMTREHIFLAVHEYASHHGWLLYTIGGTLMLVGIPAFAVSAKKAKKPKDDENV